MSIIGRDKLGVRASVDGFDKDIQGRMSRGWVAGSSCPALQLSRYYGICHFDHELDIGAPGH